MGKDESHKFDVFLNTSQSMGKGEYHININVNPVTLYFSQEVT